MALGTAMVGLGGCQGSSDGTDTPIPGSGDGASDGGETATAVPEEVTLRGVSPGLKDDATGLEVRGLPPNTEVEVAASTMGASGRWHSSATFRSEAGGFSLSDQPPISGDWSTASDAAPIWAMKPGSDTVGSFFEPGREYEVVVRARVDGEEVASTSLVRRRFSPAVTADPVGAEDLVGYYASPPSNRSRPGVILLHDSGGEVMERQADMVAARGYHALALKYFGPEEALPDTFVDIPLSYFDRAASWLREQEGVAGDGLGVYGQAAGGEGALFLAAHADWVGAVVAKMPSAVATWGLEYGGPTDASRWSVDGESLTYLPLPNGSPETPYRSALNAATPREIENATFPIENSSGPILLISGGLDGYWPSGRLAEYGVSQLETFDEEGRIEHVSYEKTGHRIPIPITPTFPHTTGNDIGEGATVEAVARAATDAWSRTLSTFADGLA